MDSGGVFPAEMPERGRSLADPLDADTAERLVAGRVGPDDAPPGYAGVARVLQAAAGPARPEELAGREAALALFRAYGPSPGRRHRPHWPWRARWPPGGCGWPPPPLPRLGYPPVQGPHNPAGRVPARPGW